MSSLRRRLLSGTIYTLASILAVQAISLATSVIYARFLGSEKLGVLQIFTQLSAAIVPLSSLGLGVALARTIPEHQKKGPEGLPQLLSTAFLITLGAGIIVSIAYFVLAGSIAALYGVAELVVLIQITASLVVFDAVLNYAVAMVQGFQRVKELAILGLIARAASVPVIFFMTLTWGLLGVVLAGIVTLGMNLVIYGRAITSILRAEGLRIAWSRFDRATATILLRTALPLFASFILLRPALLFQSSVLALHIGYAELGLFRVATSLYRIGLLVPSALSIPLLPAISEMYADGTRDRTRGQLSSLLRITALVSLPITMSLALASAPIIDFLYGPEFLAAAPLVFVISAAAFVDTLGAVVENTLLATGRTIHVLGLTGMQAVVIGVGSYVFITTFGLIGIGFAMLLNAIVYASVVGTYFLKRQELSLREFRGSVALALGAFTVATVIVMVGGLGDMPIVAGFVFTLVLIESKLLSEQDRSTLRDALRAVFGRHGST